MVRPTYAEIDLDAIRHNVAAIGRLIAPAAFCAVVKADGYGHGDVPVAGAALQAGAEMLAVALVEEGVRLREAGIEARIMVLSEPGPDGASDIVRWDLEPTVYTARFAEALASAGSDVDVHLKVDTGMHRVGAPPGDLAALVEQVNGADSMNLASVWTHFAVAETDSEFTNLQIDRFDEALSALEVPATHLANTAGAVLYPDARRSLCRIGIGIYGLHPSPATARHVELRPAMRLVTHVTHVQRLPAGASPSYGRVRPLPAGSTVVTAPVGYADGFPRAMTSAGHALIGGRRFPLAGSVTMDQIVIDVGDEDVDVGEEVVLLGGQGEDAIGADEWGAELGTISYEVVCSIGPRVPRRYT